MTVNELWQDINFTLSDVEHSDPDSLNNILIKFLAEANKNLENHYFVDVLEIFAYTQTFYDQLLFMVETHYKDILNRNDYKGLMFFEQFRNKLVDLIANRRTLKPDVTDTLIENWKKDNKTQKGISNRGLEIVSDKQFKKMKIERPR